MTKVCLVFYSRATDILTLYLAIRLPRNRFQPYAQYKPIMLFLKKSSNFTKRSTRSFRLHGKRPLRAVYSLEQRDGVEMSPSFVCWVMVWLICIYISINDGERRVGGTLVSRGEISIGDLTTLLMYTVYVGSGLQMLTYVTSWWQLHSLLTPRPIKDHFLCVSVDFHWQRWSSFIVFYHARNRCRCAGIWSYW